MPAKSLDRLVHIAAFATSMYNTVKRVQKPFKDLQNGTYELVYPEKRLRLIGEKVRWQDSLALHRTFASFLAYMNTSRRTCPSLELRRLHLHSVELHEGRHMRNSCTFEVFYINPSRRANYAACVALFALIYRDLSSVK